MHNRGFPGDQKYPPVMGAWSRAQLGWATPVTITADGLYSIFDAGSIPGVGDPPQVYKIDHNMPNGEYLLIENRQKTGFDLAMPNAGLAIYHIDNSASYTNEGFPGQSGWPGNGKHYRVALLQKDGKYNLEKGNNRGDSGDLYTQGFEIGPSVDPTTGPFPNTDSYQGGNLAQTGIRIFDISASGTTMTFRVSFLTTTTTTTTPTTTATTGGGGSCGQAGAACTSNSQCCSNTCSTKGRNAFKCT